MYNVPMYFHVFHDHAPALILLHGDLHRLCEENLERIHSVRKRDMKQGSNKRARDSGGRVYQTLRLECVRNQLLAHGFQRTDSRWARENEKRKAREYDL